MDLIPDTRILLQQNQNENQLKNQSAAIYGFVIVSNTLSPGEKKKKLNSAINWQQENKLLVD